MKLKYSFLIPSFNSSSTVLTCIRSIYSQKIDSFEVIVIDDSNDESKSFFDSFVPSFPNLFVYFTNRISLSKKRKMLIDKAQGQYLVFLDSDDEILPDSFARIGNYLQSHSFDLIFCPYVIASSDDENREICPNKPPLKPESFEESFFSSNKFNSCWSKILSKDLFQKSQVIPDVMLGDDKVIIASSLSRLRSIGYCGYPFYLYRRNPFSITHKPRAKNIFEDFFRSYRFYYATIRTLQIESACLLLGFGHDLASNVSYFFHGHARYKDILPIVSSIKKDEVYSFFLLLYKKRSFRYSFRIKERLFIFLFRFCFFDKKV